MQTLLELNLFPETSQISHNNSDDTSKVAIKPANNIAHFHPEQEYHQAQGLGLLSRQCNRRLGIQTGESPAATRSTPIDYVL